MLDGIMASTSQKCSVSPPRKVGINTGRAKSNSGENKQCIIHSVDILIASRSTQGMERIIAPFSNSDVIVSPRLKHVFSSQTKALWGFLLNLSRYKRTEPAFFV